MQKSVSQFPFKVGQCQQKDEFGQVTHSLRYPSQKKLFEEYLLWMLNMLSNVGKSFALSIKYVIASSYTMFI